MHRLRSKQRGIAVLLLLAACIASAAPAAAMTSRQRRADAQRLAFVTGSTIFETTVDGTVRQIVRMENSEPWSLAWSPDGSRLAFLGPFRASSRGGHVPGGGLLGASISIVDARTGRVREVISVPHMAMGHLAWSPDGSRLAFVGATVYESVLLWAGPLYWNVYTVRVDGTGLTPVTLDGLSTMPVWSPDGQRLAYLSSRDGTSRVYVSRPEVAASATLVSRRGLGYSAESPEWSPNGRWIAYLETPLLPASITDYPEREIWLARPDGSGQRSVGQTAHWIDWSPDSRHLAYTKTPGDHAASSEVHVLRLGGSTRFVAHGEFPRWAPDGRHLALTRSARTYPFQTLMVVDSRTGSGVRVVEGGYSFGAYRWTLRRMP